MTSISKKVMFLFGCIGVRIFLAFVVKRSPTWMWFYYGLIALLPAMGFTTLYLTDSRKIGMESSAPGGKIWWNHMRPLHAAMYFWFAYAAINKKAFAWKILMMDALIGLAVWLRYKM